MKLIYHLQNLYYKLYDIINNRNVYLFMGDNNIIKNIILLYK